MSRCRPWIPVAVAVICGLSTWTPAGAQTGPTSSAISGSVRDQSGAFIPDVRVTITNLDTNLEREVLSDQDGHFEVPGLPPGSYRVRLDYGAFATQIFDAMELQLGSSVDLNVTLRIAPIEQTITVAAASTTIDVHSTAISTVVTQPQIERLPINGRNFISFSIITPGTIVDRMPLQGATATSGLSFNGQHARSNNITVDGLDNNDDATGGVRATFSQDAVREFQVLAQSYSAEFGKASAGVVNIVTKSGTNVTAGTLFGYVRNDRLNAKEHFEKFDSSGNRIDQPKAPYGQQQMGGVLGGPIRKDRAFFFGSVERLRTTANNFVTIDDRAVVDVLGRPAGTTAALLRGAGFPIETGHVPYAIRSNAVLLKVDDTIRPTQTLTVRYNYADGYHGNTESWGGQIAQSRGASLANTDQALAASLSSIASSRSLNEVRFQVASRHQRVLSLDPTCGPCIDDSKGGPTIDISGEASAGRNRVAPQTRDNILYQVLETFTRESRNHLWKVGADFDTIDHRRSSLPLYFGGRFVFSALPAVPGLLPVPVGAIQAFALGLPAAYVQGYGDPRDSGITPYLSWFAQDQWHPRDGLTINAGVRYQTRFWEQRTYSLPGYGSYRTPADRNDLAPRLGVAWSPTAVRTTSIHAAYGIYYDDVIAGALGVANVVNGRADGVRTLVLRFPSSVAAWNASSHHLPEPRTPFPSLIIGIDPNLQTSYAHQASFGVDHALGGDMALLVNAIYVHGRHQLGTIDYNPIVPALGAGRRPYDVGGQPGTSASVLQYTSYGETWYRGLTLGISKRLSGRLQFAGAYVFSKAEDNTSDFQSAFVPENNGRGRDPANLRGLPVGFDPLRERGPSQQDQRHRFTLSGSYVAAGGLQLATIATVGSGVPYNLLVGADLNGDGDGGAFPADRPRRDVMDPLSSIGRNAGRLPKESSVDVRVSRKFHFVARSRVEPIFEVFNLFNAVNYTDVNNVFGTGRYPDQPAPHFGEFQRAGVPRQAQIAARLTF